MVGVFEAAAIFSVAPVVDLLIHPELEGASPLTVSLVGILERVGLSATLATVLGVFVVFSLFKSLFQLFARHLILRAKYAVQQDLIVGTFHDFFHARWHFFASDRQGKLLNTFIREMGVVGNAFGAMALFFAALLQLVMYMAVPLYLSWRITAVSTAATLIFGAPFLLLGGISYRLGKRNTSTANDLSSVISESLSAVKIILGFGNPDKNVEMVDRTYDAHRRVTLISQTLDVGIPILYLPIGLSIMAVALIAGRRWGVPLAESAAVLYSLLRMVPVIGQVLQQKTSLDNFFPSYEQVLSLRRRATELRQESGARLFIGMNSEIRLHGVSFAHPGNEPILRGIDLVVPKEKMIAIVGESGAGKSSLIDLIMGFHPPTAGKITVDGTPLPAFDIYSYRRRIGYVPQESVLFNMSIRDNLQWAKEDASQEEIEKACQQANAAGFIKDLPEGYATIVGDRGVRLSGGQVQRVALARAILRKPDLLILDEATSALDTKSERMIQQSIEELAKKTTLIVVAHRLSTIVQADYIYVLGKSGLVEEGSYAELMAKKGLFARMAEYQELSDPQAA
ncbi:MAG: ABC transporter ATP-binding protein [Elusimicrobiota bacterium]